MKCKYCEQDFEEKEMGMYRGDRVCFKCATDRGIPADFEEFLSENPDSYGDDARPPLSKEKDPGNIVVAFLLSAVIAGAAGYTWFFKPLNLDFGEYRTGLYLVAGILIGLSVRLLQKGRGSTYQNITGIMVIIAFFIPQMLVMQRDGSFDLMQLMKDFVWLLGAVFACYLLLVDLKKKP